LTLPAAAKSGHPARRLRILVLTSTFPRGQGDTTPPFVLDLCRELAREFDVHVLAPHAPGARPEENMDGVHVHRFRYLPERAQRLAYDGGITARLRRCPWLLLQVPFFVVALTLAACRLARALAPDAIHAHWLLPQGWAALLVRRACGRAVPVLCTLHGSDVHAWNAWPLRALKARALRAMTHLTAVSAALRDAALAAGADPARIEVVPMGVDVDGVFRCGPESGRVPGSAVFAGRLVPGKGVEVLLEAWANVPRATGRALTILGDGPARGALTDQARRLGIDGCVHFVGARPPPVVGDHFRAAAVAVFPFTGPEGLGIVVAEAQACGCPVIVSDIPSMAELVEPGITGSVTPAGDVAALSAAMGAVLGDPAHAARLGRAGREAATRRFAWKSVGACYRQILLKMVGMPLSGV
jgi:glycosyltransferase involved in cell wall biosynthesis